jgi:signal transduction histidine kinase
VVRVKAASADATIDRVAVLSPTFVNRRRGRIRKSIDWILRSPVRMLVLIAVLVGLPVNVFGQVLANRARDDFTAAALSRVRSGAAAGASLVAERVTAVTYHTETLSTRTQLRNLVELGDLAGLESTLSDELPLYSTDVQRLFVLDALGRFVASSPAQRDLRGIDFSRTSYFIGAASPWHPFVSPVTATEFATGATAVTIAIPVYDGRGVPIGLLCASIDLTRAREWLAPITQLFDVVYVIDEQGRVMFGDPRVDPTPLRDLTSDPNVAAALARRPGTLETFDEFSASPRFLSASPVAGLGWNVFVADSPAPTTQRLAQLTDGLLLLRTVLVALLLAGGVLLSLTTLRQQRIAMANLTRLNKTKSDFVSVVSHEFRTPLTGIQGFSEMIRDEQVTIEEAKDFANDINVDAKRLARMISEMLDLDRMESGRMGTDREQVDLVPLIQDAIHRQAASAPKHQFGTEIEPGLPKIWADRDRVTQVMTNLLSNAVKYSPEGGAVTVGARSEKNMAHVWVRDQGLGIPAGSLEEVFERYSRLHTTKARTIQGTGLGLPIVREICKLHGGHAWVESEVGQGSTFHVTLPFDLRGGA